MTEPVANRSESIVIDIPRWQPAFLNKLMRVHWRTEARLKRNDRDMLWAHYRRPVATTRRRVDLEIRLKATQRRAPDADGVWKSLLDGLVCCDALVDDAQEWCEQGTVTFVRGAAWGTRITLTDVPLPGRAEA
jgi:hypothetical protein